MYIYICRFISRCDIFYCPRSFVFSACASPVCICVQICAFVYIHMYVHTYVDIYPDAPHLIALVVLQIAPARNLYVCIYINIYVYRCTLIYLYKYTCVYIWMYIYIYYASAIPVYVVCRIYVWHDTSTRDKTLLPHVSWPIYTWRDSFIFDITRLYVTWPLKRHVTCV